MLEDFRLKVFVTVAKEGSFTKAAAALGVTQPAVSQNIADLEKMTGNRLFDRLRGEVVLTPQGKLFMEYAERILGACASAGNMFSALQPSTIRISVSEELYSFFVAPALERFGTIHPEISFERAIFDDADLVLSMRPAPETPFEINHECIARIRVSVSLPPKMGDYRATHEKSTYFDLLYKPSPSFACTRLCRLLKEFLTSF